MFTIASTTSVLLPDAPSLASHLMLAGVTAVAAAINSVAGGGTILTFPALAAILPASPARLVIANATSTIGLWPGALTAAWEYRHERRGQPPWAVWLMLPSVAGSLVGTALVLVLPPVIFDLLVPWLILLAASLFAIQPRVSAWLARRRQADQSATTDRPSRSTLLLAASLQFLVAVYGGYFGAGIGILMLAVLGSLDLGDVHQLNGVKNVLGMGINACAAGLFALGSLTGTAVVAWTEVGVMAVAAAVGGIVGARLARRSAPARIRRLIAVIGFALAGYHFLR